MVCLFLKIHKRKDLPKTPPLNCSCNVPAALDVEFNATSEDFPAILRICHLVDGMPLAIELAAAWVRTLTCDEIAQRN